MKKNEVRRNKRTITRKKGRKRKLKNKNDEHKKRGYKE